MRDLAREPQSHFSIWLRTGLLPVAVNDGGVEAKFNPWHDPANGQFTFANSGRYFAPPSGKPFVGGGGSFGGGGASGDWTDGPARPSPPRRREIKPDASAVRSRSPSSPSPPPPAPDPASQFRRIMRNGYEYQIDRNDRTRRVSGELTVGAQRRSRRIQAQAGGPDRLPTDDGGHYIARRFNGPAEAFNHFAQDSEVNRRRYRALEEQWARGKRLGKSISVKIFPYYIGSSQRPDVVDVWFWTDGFKSSLKFENKRKSGK